MRIDEAVQRIIERIPAWHRATEIQAEQLAGLTNTNYRIMVDGERYVLRISGNNTERLGINRLHEVAALQAAAAAGLAPDLVTFLAPEGHLVTRWVDGRHWTAAEFRTPQQVRRLTDVVKRIHALPPSGAVFDPVARIASFLAIAQRFGVNPPANIELFQETSRAILADQQSDSTDWQRFCHNDLVSVNYLFNERDQALKVLDWEFSGWGDIYYDLATVVYTHDSEGPIPPELENEMLECYFGTITNFQRRRLCGMKYLLMLFSGTWALAQAGMQQAGLIPPVEDFNYIEFGDYLFSHDIRELQAHYHQQSGQ